MTYLVTNDSSLLVSSLYSFTDTLSEESLWESLKIHLASVRESRSPAHAHAFPPAPALPPAPAPAPAAPPPPSPPQILHYMVNL